MFYPLCTLHSWAGYPRPDHGWTLWNLYVASPGCSVLHGETWFSLEGDHLAIHFPFCPVVHGLCWMEQKWPTVSCGFWSTWKLKEPSHEF